MTRKQALYKALEQINEKEVIEKINEIINDMPLTNWNEKTIFDTIDQFIFDNNRMPTTTDFKKKGLPPHPVIKLRFGVTLKEFLNKYYAVDKKCNSQIYYTKTKEEWRDDFINQYHTSKPTKAEEYNEKRNKGTPSWGTVARLYNINKWSLWLQYCNIVPYLNANELIRRKINNTPLKITSEYNEYREKNRVNPN